MEYIGTIEAVKEHAREKILTYFEEVCSTGEVGKIIVNMNMRKGEIDVVKEEHSRFKKNA